MKKNVVNYKLVNILLIILIIAILYWISGLWMGILGKFIAVLLPFIIGFAIAYALYPLKRKLMETGLSSFLSVGIIYFILLGFIILMGIIVVPMFYDQLILFLSNISAVITDLSSRFALDLGFLQNSLKDASSEIIRELGGHISNGAISIVNSSISFLTNFIVVLIVSVYFLVDMENIRKRIILRLKKYKNRSFNYVKTLDCEVTNYFSGLFKTIIIQFFEYTIVFFLIGHPNWLVLGILAAVTTVIPYFGGLLTNILALIISSVISTKMFILTLIVCIICPNIDGYIIGPKVYGQTNKLHPLVIIFSVFAGGVIGGIWGIALSLPVAIIIIATIKFFRKDINDTIDTIKENR
ncbi:MAG: AI-2E family transporter [Bacilli bacterium]|nr:AI-2E family transporter [Bacilli bacterium]